MTGALEAFAFHALPAEVGASIDLQPPGVCRIEAEPESNQRQRFVDYEICGDQDLTGIERRVACRATREVSRIGAVGTRHPPRGVDKQTVHRP
jgi:hypothetical protein